MFPITAAAVKNAAARSFATAAPTAESVQNKKVFEFVVLKYFELRKPMQMLTFSEIWMLKQQ